MERIIIPVQAVQQGGLRVGLLLQHNIRCLPFWRWEILSGWALGSAPVALSDIKRTTDHTSIYFVRFGVYKIGLHFDNRTGAALVVHTKHLSSDLKFPSNRGCRQRLDEFNLSLPVDNPAGIEGGNAGYLDRFLGCIEVDDLLGVDFEGYNVESASISEEREETIRTKDQRISREDREIRVKLLW
jgi:hypothetical protein